MPERHGATDGPPAGEERPVGALVVTLLYAALVVVLWGYAYIDLVRRG